MLAGGAWIGKLSVSLIRCLAKMSPLSSTSTGSQIATWRRSLTWTRREFSHNLQSPFTAKDVPLITGHRRFSLKPAERDILPHRQSQLSDLTFRLRITTSLKSIISQKRVCRCRLLSFSNPLQFWEKHATEYLMSETARRLLCIPASSAQYERDFSSVGHTGHTNNSEFI